MKPFEGFLWKRAPRESDTDKKRIRRLFGPSSTNKSLYKLRYFSLSLESNVMTYHSDKSKSDTLGAVDISTATDVVLNHIENEAVPSEWPINIVTPSRVWILYAETVMIRDEWVGHFQAIINSGGSEGSDGKSIGSRTDALKQNDSISTSVPPIVPRQSSLTSIAEDSKPRVRSRKGTMLFGRAASNELTNHQINIAEQSRQVTQIKSKSMSSVFTGNMPLDTLSVFSLSSFKDTEFFDTMRSWCSGGKASAQSGKDVTRYVLDKCVFDMSPREGDVLVQEGERFQWVYFVVKGEIARRKEWGGGSQKAIVRAVKGGKCVGDVECLLFDGLSPYTLIVGENTALMKMRREDFVKEFTSDVGGTGREGIFSRRFMDSDFEASSDQSDACFPQRFKKYSFDAMSCHPLFETHPKDNVQEMAGLFCPISFAAGDTLIREEEESNEFFLVVEGSCNVFKKDVKGEENLVHSTRSGDWLGEAGLFRSSRRNASVCAFTDVVVLKTDAKGFRRFIDKGGPNVRHAVERSVTNHMASSIKSIPLFQDLSDSVIESVCVCMQVKELQADTEIVSGGVAHHDEFFLVMHGHVNGSIHNSGDFSFKMRPPVVDVIGENDFFGEGWLVQATYTSEISYYTPTNQVVVLYCSISDFKPVVEACPVLRLRLEERLNTRRTRLEMTHSLTAVIAEALGGTGGALSRSGEKASADNTVTEDMEAELVYLRAEVERLGGTPYLPLPARHPPALNTATTSSVSSLSSSSPSPSPLTEVRKRGGGSRRQSLRATKQFSSDSISPSTVPPAAARSKSPVGRFKSLFGLGGSPQGMVSESSDNSSPQKPNEEDARKTSSSEKRSSVGTTTTNLSTKVLAPSYESTSPATAKSRRR